MYCVVVATLGEIVKERREALKLTTRQLGDEVGASGAYISQIENGKVKLPGPAILAGLARVLRIGEDALLQTVGYLQDQVVAIDTPDDVSPEELWTILVERFDGDKEAARRYLYVTLGKALEQG